MKLSSEDIATALNQATEMAVLYRQTVFPGGADYCRSANELARLCTQYLGKTINTIYIPGVPKSVRGSCIRYPDHYDIALYAEMGADWDNYVLCKELFHVILDDQPTYRTLEIYDHIEEVVNKFFVADSEPGPAATSEMMAEIAAMEFLFPYHARALLLQGPAVDYEATSGFYNVPQGLVERYLSESYMKHLNPPVR